MKTGTDFKQASYSTSQNRASAIRLGNPAEDLEQGRFPRPVPSDNAKHLALLDLEAHIPQGPEFLDLVTLDNLPAANEVDRLAPEVAGLASDHVAQRGVSFALGSLMTDQVAL